MTDHTHDHRRIAIDAFNHVWTLLDKPDRTVDDVDEMIHEAHASVFHWRKAGTALNHARGEWQVARVYTVLNRPEAALHHARRCLEITEANGFGDFDLAFAYEAMARALACSGDRDQAAQLHERRERPARRSPTPRTASTS
jgi:hypothetical protein